MSQIRADCGFAKRLLLSSLVLFLFAFVFLIVNVPILHAAPKTPIIVTTTSETSSGGNCTLRDAINAANTNSAVFGCSAGSGADTINFNFSGIIVLTGSLPLITQDVTIDGSGQPITVSGSNLYQILSVGSGIGLGINYLTLQNGNATAGGAIHNSGNLTITNSSFVGNVASSFGGAIENSGNNSVSIGSSTFSTNSASDGGGAVDTSAGGSLIILNSRFTNNTTSNGHGGAVYVFHVNAAIGNSSFTNNVAGGLGQGGGVQIEGSASTVITNSAFVGNTAEHGGAIGVLTSTVGITNTTISGNMANNNGGGINQQGSGVTSLNNVTIANNTADYNIDTAGDGGGINNTSGTVNFKNTILASNLDKGGQAPDCSGTLNSQDYNLIKSTTGCTIGGTTTHNKTGQDPKLGAPAYYGGSTTPIQILLPGSPALNAGDNTTCASTDQRGVARPVGGVCDMGAYEGVGYGLYMPLITK